MNRRFSCAAATIRCVPHERGDKPLKLLLSRIVDASPDAARSRNCPSASLTARRIPEPSPENLIFNSRGVVLLYYLLTLCGEDYGERNHFLGHLASCGDHDRTCDPLVLVAHGRRQALIAHKTPHTVADSRRTLFASSLRVSHDHEGEST